MNDSFYIGPYFMLTCGYMMHAVIGSGQKGTGNSQQHNWVQGSSSEWVRTESVARAREWECFRVPLKHRGLALWSCQPSGTPLLSRSLCRADGASHALPLHRVLLRCQPCPKGCDFSFRVLGLWESS